MSPLLDAQEKAQAWNLGQSLDSKKVTSALGYLDLKQICFCLAQAINKHIKFSRGQFFLSDLKQLKAGMRNDPRVEGANQLEFSYNLGKDMKIDIEAAKEKKNQKL